MEQNADPNAAVPGPPLRKETSRHPMFVGRDLEKDRLAAYGDGLRCDLLVGHASIVIRWDPNTGELVDTLTNRPELAKFANDMKQEGVRPGSAVQLALKTIVGELPMIVEGRKGKEDEHGRIAKRLETLMVVLENMKLLFGKLPFCAGKDDTVARIEEEFHRYRARGNPLPVGVLRYLESDDVKTKQPLPDLGGEVDDATKPLLPLVFNTRKVPSLSKLLYQLQQSKAGELAIKGSTQEVKANKKRILETNVMLSKAAKAMAAEYGIPYSEYTAAARGDFKKWDVRV